MTVITVAVAVALAVFDRVTIIEFDRDCNCDCDSIFLNANLLVEFCFVTIRRRNPAKATLGMKV